MRVWNDMKMYSQCTLSNEAQKRKNEFDWTAKCLDVFAQYWIENAKLLILLLR